MNTPRKVALFVFLIVFFVAVSGVVIFLVYKNGILADEQKAHGEEIDRKFLRENSLGNFELVTYKLDNKLSFYLQTERSLFSVSEVKLSGFEKDINFCNASILNFSSEVSAVCVYGDVGVHSRNIQLIRFSSEDLKPIPFIKADKSSNNVFSDTPDFGFIDKDSTGRSGFFIDNRNYAKNPVVDNIRSYYYFSNMALVFDRDKEIESVNSDIIEGGKIN